MSIFPVDSIVDILFVLYALEVSGTRVRMRKVMCVAALHTHDTYIQARASAI